MGDIQRTLGAIALQGIGTVFFGTYRFSGESGTLEAETVVLVTSDGGSRRVPAPMRRDDRTVYGDGWTFMVGGRLTPKEAAKAVHRPYLRRPFNGFRVDADKIRSRF